MAAERAAHLLRPGRRSRHRPEPARVRRRAGPGPLDLRARAPAGAVRPHQPRERRLPVRRRRGRGVARQRTPGLRGRQRPRLAAPRRAARGRGHVAHHRLVVPQHRRARRRRDVRIVGAAVERARRRRRGGADQRGLRPRPVGARPLGAPGARVSALARPHPRHRGRAAPAGVRRRTLHHRRPERDRRQPLQRAGRVGAARQPRLVARRHAGRRLDSGPLHDHATAVGRAGPAPRLEHRQRRRGPVAPLRGHGGARRGEPPAGRRRPLHAEPGLREADPVGLLLRPLARRRDRAAPRAGDAPGHRLREGPRRRHAVPRGGLLQDLRRPHRRRPRSGGRAARPASRATTSPPRCRPASRRRPGSPARR